MISPEGNELKNPPQNYTNIVIGGLIKDQYECELVIDFYEVGIHF